MISIGASRAYNSPRMAFDEKRFVYIIRSDVNPSHHYTGLTSDVAARLDWHNDGPCGYTMNDRPWSLVVAMEFPSEATARQFGRI